MVGVERTRRTKSLAHEGMNFLNAETRGSVLKPYATRLPVGTF